LTEVLEVVSNKNSSNVEKIVGMEEYISSTRGMGGEIKREPNDFFVEEIAEVELHDDGNYGVVRVRKSNWDTLNFARVLSNILGISQKRIGFAGTKDKRAVSIQYFTIKNLEPEKVELIEKVRLRDAEIEFLGYSRKPIQLGDLLGNVFRVKVYGCRNGKLFETTKRELEEKGTPNFFGLQRFGTVRFITHEVGRLILQRRYEDAFWTYVAKPFEMESEEVRKIREEIWKTRDVRLGLRELPKHLRYERLLLQKLREGRNEREALLSLPKNLKMMFIHAYQSYIFNKLLSERIREFGTLKKIEDGDWACYVTVSKSKPTFQDCSRVGGNRRRVEFLIDKRFACLALPLIGYETELEGWNLKAKEFLEADGISLSDFKGEYKEFSSAGSFRPADMLIEITDLEFSPSNEASNFSFYLPRGCYATVLLREFLKTELT
jgi:tRNA pseudouridine13 synthase